MEASKVVDRVKKKTAGSRETQKGASHSTRLPPVQDLGRVRCSSHNPMSKKAVSMF